MDNGDGLRLGMTRTIIDKQNLDWLASDAYKDPKIPLHAQMGTGHMNASRALQQFGAGQWQPNQGAPALGWDYNTITANTNVDYQLKKPLKAGSFVSLTLSWDRLVELEDKNNNQAYDEGENFRDRGLNNLDLYLVQDTPNGSTSIACSSVSEVDSVEHIFCPVPTAGKYKIRIQYKKQINEAKQPYALAWWTVQ